MRVLHVISDENVGGAGVLLTSLLHCFSADRVESAVALPAGSALLERLKKERCAVYELKHSCNLPSLRSVVELCGVIARQDCAIVHANAALNARIAGRLMRRGVVFTRHCYDPASQKARSAPLRLLNDFLCDAAIATAEVVTDSLLQSGVAPHKLHLILNGSLPVRTVTPEELSFYRQKWSLPENAFVVGICARLEHCKGQDVFLRAAAEVAFKRPSAPIFFLIVGCGSQESRLRALCKGLGLEDRVVFTGFASDVAPVYRLLDLNVNCSRGTETSCLALSEGMSAGVPMAISDYGGNAAMLGDGSAGVCFPCEDHASLARIILNFFDDPSMRAMQGRAAYERYQRHYTARRMAEETEAVYRWVLKKRRGEHPIR